MRGDLPTGTVTFVFTDIEGSTQLLHDLGAAGYAEALETHRRALRAAFTHRDGVEVDTQGDAFFFAFPSAPEAVAAAVDGQDALAPGPIRVRMGLHTGTPMLTSEGYVGTDVHRAARIAAVAHGGQIVTSSSTRALIDAAGLVDLGLHRLKDLSAAEHIHQVGTASFPPLRSLYRSNLPSPATPFIGRERETAAVLDLLGRAAGRLVTLTGPGGSGKTRLALQAAAEASDDFPGGVFWVPLADVADPALVPSSTAAAIGCSGALDDWLAGKRVLLVLDNVEHLLDAAGWVAGLLADLPELRVLATTREPFRIAAEQQYAISSLDETAGLELFTARALSVDPDFSPDGAVSEICRRLDQLPLAIELAAARVKSLSTAQILARLGERLQLLTTGTRDSPVRHRSLRAAIAWSYELLTDSEQQLFRRFGVFSGGCTLDAAVQVLGGDVETLESLVDKSLVLRTGDRFWLLETIREYALDRLADDEGAELRRRHTLYFASLAESAHLSVEACDLGQNHALVTPELANLRAAIDAADRAGDRVLALSIAVALEQFWVGSNPREGRQRLTALLRDLPAQVPAVLQARAVRTLGGTTYIDGDFDAGTAHHRQALALFREIGDEAAVGHLLTRLAFDALRLDRVGEASHLLAEADVLPATRSDMAQQLSLRAEIAWSDDDREEAVALLQRAADTAAEIGFTWWQTEALLTLAEYASVMGRPAFAAGSLSQLLQLAQRIGDRLTMAYGLTLAARLIAEAGDDEAAGIWWGAVEAESTRLPITQWDAERPDLAVDVVRPTDGFVAGYVQGRSVTMVEAVDLAVDAMRALAAGTRQPSA